VLPPPRRKKGSASFSNLCLKDALDVAGRYEVTAGRKTYDIIPLVDVESCSIGVVTYKYLDRNGRIILWRKIRKL